MPNPGCPIINGNKKCNKCLEWKPLSEFYKRNDRRNGAQPKCKICQSSAHKKWASSDRSLEIKRECNRRYYATEKGKLTSRLSKRRQTQRGLSRIHNNTLNAIKRGILIRRPCEICGAIKVHAHHDDYSKPLDVRWLCQKHHNEHHQGLYAKQN